ncbi:MAG: hypothetical protein ACOYJD_08400 [Christensenellales bacterium]|jgi:sortase (surface protein transpeptidase)
MSRRRHKTEREKSSLIPKIIALILILAGCAVILSVFGAQWAAGLKQAELRRAYAKLPAVSSNEIVDTADTPPDVLPGDPYEESDMPLFGSNTKITPLCLLRIPKIDLDVVVAESIRYSVLRYAVGHFPERQCRAKLETSVCLAIAVMCSASFSIA